MHMTLKSVNYFHIAVEQDQDNSTNSEPSKEESQKELDEDMIEDDPEFEQTVQTEEKPYECHVCTAKFTKSNHLTRHMTLHRAVLLHKCDKCEKAFATPEHLEAHQKEGHIDKPYICTVCNKNFSRGEHLIQHLKLHLESKNDINQLKCTVCETEFSR